MGMKRNRWMVWRRQSEWFNVGRNKKCKVKEKVSECDGRSEWIEIGGKYKCNVKGKISEEDEWSENTNARSEVERNKNAKWKKNVGEAEK